MPELQTVLGSWLLVIGVTSKAHVFYSPFTLHPSEKKGVEKLRLSVGKHIVQIVHKYVFRFKCVQNYIVTHFSPAFKPLEIHSKSTVIFDYLSLLFSNLYTLSTQPIKRAKSIYT